MNSEQWAKLKNLFAEARALQPAHQTSYVEQQCADDPQVHRELVAMIEAHTHDDSFLMPLKLDELQAASGVTRSGVAAGTRIGRYEICSLIATGGMGEVYLAKRADESFEKRVAIKIVRQSIATDAMMQRFHRERQLLANLEHPNISRLLDGGATDDGLPYLVMEYIAGEAITDYCNDQSIQQRLDLFLTTCQAVQYAHQRLIVHRDIKPKNILVTSQGEVKLLDFGISRLVEDRGQDEQTVTMTRWSALTPEYSSPEQIRGEAATTATDVYSLGVVLYELLSGHRPHKLIDMPRYEAERAICELDPVPPSVTINRNGAAKPPGNARLAKQLRGDLDTIVVTALQKDPSRRYGSVEQLADDIRRYLDGQPLTARRDTMGYRLGKFIKRNKPQVAAAVVASLAMLVALCSSLISLSRANESKRIATQQTRIAQAAHGEAQGVVDFLETLLGTASPFKRGNGVTVLDLLADAEGLIESQLADRPGVEANVRMALARTLRNLMMYAETIPHLKKSLAYFRETRDPNDPVIAECLSTLAQARAEQSFSGKQSSEGVVAMQLEALAIRRKNTGGPHPDIADNLRMLAIAMWAEAHPQPPTERIVALFIESLAIYEALDLLESAGAARCRVDLANAYAARNEFEQAERDYVEALRVYDALPEGDNQFSLDAIDKYAAFLARTNQPKLAATMLEMYRAQTPAGVNLISARNAVWKLASIRFYLGQPERGEKALNDAMILECKWLLAANTQQSPRFDGLIERLQAPNDPSERVGLFGDALVAFATFNKNDPRLVVDQMQIATTATIALDGTQAAKQMLTRTAASLVNETTAVDFTEAINSLQASIIRQEHDAELGTAQR